MKKILYIFLFTLLLSCNSENSDNCFQKAGNIIETEVQVSAFDKVTVHERIELIITQGDTQKVVVKTGENLLNDITVEVVNNELILKNFNTCNFIRDYDLTKVYITAPNLTLIRNASEYNISSNGTLTYPSLYLMSVGDKNDYLPIGDFNLSIKNNNLSIWSNGIANFYLKGTTTNLDLSFSNGDTRFEGKEFIAQHVKVRQVSSNDLLIFPIQSLKGHIYSTGNVISFNKPAIIDVKELSDYGKLIFK